MVRKNSEYEAMLREIAELKADISKIEDNSLELIDELNVVRELWAQAAGASRITYHGTPQIKQKMAVGGSFILKD